MFFAIGKSVVRLPLGQFQVEVNFFADDRPGRPASTQTFVVLDKPTLLVRVAEQLQLLKQAADDAATAMDIVGKNIGSI